MLHSIDIKILLIDAQPLLREGLKRALETEEDIKIVAEGDNGEELIPLFDQYLPDIVIMDTNLPQKNGIEAVQELTSHYPEANVLMFSVSADPSLVIQSFKKGSRGYMLKEMDISSIVKAVKVVNEGGFYVHPKVTGDFIAEYNHLKKQEENAVFYQTVVRRPFHLLTRREAEVMQMLAEGNSNKNIGEILSMSDKTVKNHVSSILRKMEVQDRTQAVVTALKNCWVELK
ncbi:response regulator transcription factor [Planomicrobium sp. Y74]|uniref:response regulator n=1 Tax=Planomicrobium sp. Y74 TaxID=2478977 RepID=UPI000EF441CF|nr:response regulator transcription factor [Planomicrobium sp. Y74]RLQ84949.1 DNA-binding response regulator [Planomicrobium sp. Y74]